MVLRRCLLRLALRSPVPIAHDPSLVNLPADVGECKVIRNAISDYDEELITEELSRIMPKEGVTYYADPSKLNDKHIRNIYLELFGTGDFTTTKNWKRKEVKKIPGLAWSPTLMRFAEEAGKKHMRDGIIPDAARVVEHHLPGYEMHTEHPTVGRCFLYLNLLSDTVLTFDDEATQRTGHVYLPQRSLMVCSGELRWGWRVGEHSRPDKVWVGPNGLKKIVSPDMRLSIQLWKFDPQLVDRRQLQDDLEEAVKEVEAKTKRQAQEAAKRQEDKASNNGSGGGGEGDEDNDDNMKFTLPPRLKEQLMRGGGKAAPPPQGGQSILGGDLVANDKTASGAKKTIAELGQDMQLYKQSFGNVQGVMKELKKMQDTNQPVTDEWLKAKAEQTRSRASELDSDYGFDPSDPEAAWDEADRKARLYKQKLKGMNYDNDDSKAAKSMDLGFDPDAMAPLDVKQTIQKLVPIVRGGEDIVKDIPSSFGNPSR